MKWITLAAVFVALAALPTVSLAQQVKLVPIGNLPSVEGNDPAPWAYSGYSILTVSRSDGNDTPYMRTAVYDARLVEIFARVQAPPLTDKDIKVVREKDHDDIVVRGWLLAEVRPQDARAAHMSLTSLADQWANSCRYVLPKLAPPVSPFGL